MNHQDLQLKVVKQTMKKAMNISHVMKFKKITGMRNMICLIKKQRNMLQNHLA